MKQLKQTKSASGASDSFAALKKIFQEHAPDVLSDREQQQYHENKQREWLYPVEQMTDMLAQVLQQEQYEQVASTVEQEYLDNTNVLYSVEGINQSDLFRVLTLHKRARRTELAPNPENIEQIPEAKVHTIIDKVVEPNGSIHITKRIQNQESKSNMVLEQVFDGSAKEYEAFNEYLQDMKNEKCDTIDFDYREKRNKVINTCLQLLKKSWKEYHYRRERKTQVLGNERVQADRMMSDVQQDIRRYQWWITRVEEAERQEHEQARKRKYDKRYKRALDKFVDYQQREIKKGNEPKWEWEDMVAKYSFLQPYVPSVFKSSLVKFNETK